ncbi:uncharacterized protein LOC120133216 [Hibiscus syriacus]|uniref:uncharacterized protein LOC120133216 n=1 Tax=Hibiscus syriacus TaxID=106335 RepID=UPI0019241CA4|nr:uncharacterized protein LOC120133216 [Hibiscus syriacus]
MLPKLPIYQEKASKPETLVGVLRNGISNYVQELRGAKAMIDGNLVVNDETCTTDDLHEVELLLPFMKDMYIGACNQKDVVGIVNFTGSVCSFSFLNSKEPISQAVADIKDDIIRSLLSRLDIICDEVDENVWPNDDVIKETRNDPLSEKPVSQLVLHSLRCISIVDKSLFYQKNLSLIRILIYYHSIYYFLFYLSINLRSDTFFCLDLCCRLSYLQYIIIIMASC